ncbi:hypothetical protein [Oharaeibacter diazotrophicus]|uniref:hypothetical protein n=1 Tax=Oharaeibacter diazotrophicus TaxID=1920512 RepID=UPI0013F59889|nr:hypothetical protein [Oharaeibacter diazotrophicus]
MRVRIEEMEYRPADRSLVVLGVDEFHAIVTVVISPVYPRQLAADLQFVASHPDARVVVGRSDEHPVGNQGDGTVVPRRERSQEDAMDTARRDEGQPLGRSPVDEDGTPVSRPFDDRGGESAERRSEGGAKPYTTEVESYRSGPHRGPDERGPHADAERTSRRRAEGDDTPGRSHATPDDVTPRTSAAADESRVAATGDHSGRTAGGNR